MAPSFRPPRADPAPQGRPRASGRAGPAGLRALLIGVLSAAVVATPAADAGSGATGTSGGRFAAPIGLQVLTLTDASRKLRVAHRPAVARTLVTYVRYPTGHAGGASTALPLIVFAHGFNVTPAAYRGLLDAWTRAGYVVAAPLFPRERPGAPGGPTRADLVNEPADISFVIGALLAQSAETGHLLSGRIDPQRIAVAGHSDGAVATLGAAYDGRHPDPRIGATVIMSGARPDGGGLAFGPSSPPLLASMGLADAINPPANTLAYYRAAHRPKFLLELRGASHLPPYSYAQPWLAIVERITTNFLDAYLKPPAAAPPAPFFGRLPRAALLEQQP